MFHFFEAITNTKGDALIGYYVSAVDTSTGNVVNIYADQSSTPIVSVSGVANAAKVDSDGNASFYIAGGTYHLDIYATDSTTFVKRIQYLPMVDATIAAGNVSSRANLQAVIATNGEARTLVESGREGTFVFSTANLSTQVAADPQQGVYIPPTSDTTGASGAWVRKFTGPLDMRWFGVSSSASRASNTTNGQAALDFIAATSTAGVGFIKSGAELQLPFSDAAYQFNAPLEIKTCMRFFGGGGGSANGSTMLDFPDGTTGIIVQSYDTSGETGGAVSTTHPTAAGSVIEGFTFKGNYSSSESEAHGIRMRVAASIRDCYFDGWGGNGVHIEATSGSGSVHGNCNGWSVIDIRGQGVRNLLYLDGADVNAGRSSGVNGSSVRQSVIYDSSFLGSNLHDAPHASACAVVAGSLSVCTNATNRYVCKAGQETWCSTNAPPAGATSNQGWIFWQAGGTGTGIRTWTSGLTWRAGGPYILDGSGGNQRSKLNVAYSESDSPPSQIYQPSTWHGGLHGAGVNGVGGLTGEMGLPTSDQGFGVTNTAGLTMQFGETAGTTIFKAAHNTQLTEAYYQQIGTFTTGDIWGQFLNAHGVWRITGPNTAAQFGRGANQPYFFHGYSFALGSSTTDSRVLDYAAAAPGSGAHAAGEIVFNNCTSTSKELFWRCKTAGTPGTWEPEYRKIYGSATWDPASVAAGAQATTTVTVTGAALGDIAVPSFSLSLANLHMTAYVSAADTVTVVLSNTSGGAVDLASGTVRVQVTKQS